jgi:hypothetical protein
MPATMTRREWIEEMEWMSVHPARCNSVFHHGPLSQR